MASLYLARHARAAAGDADDPGLSSLGRLQAGLLADRLLELEVGAVLHSPLKRAVRNRGGAG